MLSFAQTRYFVGLASVVFNWRDGPRLAGWWSLLFKADTEAGYTAWCSEARLSVSESSLG